jgi:hypothetical protein
MDSLRFDRISKLLVRRRRSRQAAEQQSTPAPATDHGGLLKETLFVQTFQAGALTPVDGRAGRYTLTLEAGHGQTLFFSNRPDRIVGAAPTPQFLKGLGFFPDNPLNAALVVETAPGETDVAVVELYSPLYDPVTQGVVYEVEMLESWAESLEMSLQETPIDLAAIEPSFGAAHLFIDDCADADMTCVHTLTKNTIGVIANREHDGFCYSWGSWMCLPCQPRIEDSRLAEKYWISWCNLSYQACNDLCTVKGFW